MVVEMTSLWIFLRKYATESIEEYDRLYYVTVLSIFDLTSQAVESTCKHNILLSCPFPNASNDYAVFRFVATKSHSMLIRWYNLSYVVCIRRLIRLPYIRVRPQFHGIIRLVLYVIMYFIFYFSIWYVTALTAYHMFAIDVVCEFCHIHLVQAFVLKPLKAGIEKRRSI